MNLQSGITSALALTTAECVLIYILQKVKSLDMSSLNTVCSVVSKVLQKDLLLLVATYSKHTWTKSLSPQI
jgi:hypothetical protein